MFFVFFLSSVYISVSVLSLCLYFLTNKRRHYRSRDSISTNEGAVVFAFDITVQYDCVNTVDILPSRM